MATPEEDAAAAEAERVAAEAKAVEEAAKKAAASKGLTPEDRAALEAVVEKERKATRAAEKLARDAQAKLDAAEAEKLSETEREKKRADEAEARSSTATEKLRKANLISALVTAGMANPKAAARLIDGVEYDDADEPKNLDDAVKAAKAEYGDDLFKPARPVPPGNVNSSEGNDNAPPPPLNADQLAAAKSFGMTPEEYVKWSDPQYQGEPEPAKT